MNNNTTHPKGTASVAFVIGAIAGGVAALLLAPQTGKELRTKIRNGAGEAKDRVRTKSETVTGAVKGALAEARTTYKDEMEKRRPLDPEQVARRTGA
jgi:gas vesicle protein